MKTVRRAVRVTPGDLAMLQRAAAQDGLSVGALVRLAIADWLAEREEQAYIRGDGGVGRAPVTPGPGRR